MLAVQIPTPANNRTGSKQKKAKRATGSPINTFLNYRFGEMVGASGVAEWTKEGYDIESDFEQSVRHLAKLYSLDVDSLLLKKAPYPIWINDTYKAIESQLDKIDKTLTVVITEDEGRVFLATYKENQTNYGVYYIPVEPYWNLHNMGDPRAGLIGAIFYYFLRIARVPYFLEEWGEFIHSEYEMLKESYAERQEELEDVGDDEEAELIGDGKKYIETIEKRGRECLTWFDKKSQRTTFSRRIKEYQNRTEFDSELLSIARKIEQMIKKFPGITVRDSEHPDMNIVDDEQGELDYFMLGMYLSFIWTEDDWSGQSVIQTIDHFYQNGTETDYPKVIQRFDRPQVSAQHDLSFLEEFFQVTTEFLRYMYVIEEELKPVKSAQ
jgi:hypothetical protein